jgi:TonB-dependent receptor
VIDQTLFDLRDVTSGAPGTLSGDAAQALVDQGWVVNEQNIFTMAAILANPDDYPGGAAEYLDPSEPGGAQQALDIIALYDLDAAPTDPFFVFSTSQPVNNETAVIDGFEFAWQHFFGESGFGFQVNATMVNGDIEYDVYADPSVAQFALLGLSDSANAVAIYERGSWSARLAYNWRDTFLQDTVTYGLQGFPRYVKEYDQLDFQVSWAPNDNLTLALDGINVTGEGQVTYSRTENMQWWNGEADPRWVLSARYDF